MSKRVETVDEFLARGGIIQQIPLGESAIDPLYGIPKHKVKRLKQNNPTRAVQKSLEEARWAQRKGDFFGIAKNKR